MKPQYHFIILLSLGSFLPAHGMFSWLSGSDANQEGKERAKEEKQKEEKQKRVEKKKEELKLLTETLRRELPESTRLMEVIDSEDIGDPITYMFYLIEKNQSKMGEKLESEIEKKVEKAGSFISSLASLATKVGIGNMMVTLMLKQRKGIRYAFRKANGENVDGTRVKKDYISVFKELSGLEQEKQQDLVRPVTLCILMKIALCLDEKQEELTAAFIEKAFWPITLSIKPVIKQAVEDSSEKDSDWNNRFVIWAQNSLCTTKEDIK